MLSSQAAPWNCLNPTAWTDWRTSWLEPNTIKDDMLPKAENAFRLALAGYRSGAFEYLEVLDAQRTFFEQRATYVRAIAKLHDRRHERTVGVVVLHVEHSCHCVHGAVARRPVVGQSVQVVDAGLRHSHHEGGTLTGCGRCGDRATHQAGERPREREPDAGAVDIGALGAEAIERREQPRHQLGCDADAVVGHAQANVVALHAAVESADGSDAHAFNERIWDELVESTKRRQFAMRMG